MTSTKQLLLAATLTLGTAWAAPVSAQDQSPNATFLLGGDLFASGQSDNLGPVANQVLGDVWKYGDCPDTTGSYRYCDALRLGLAVYARPQCDAEDVVGGGCSSYNNVLVEPQEDGGPSVQDEIKDIHNEGGTLYNDDASFRPLDSSLLEHQRHTFRFSQNDSDSPWDRANLNLMVVAEFPQTSDGQEDDRVKSSIANACRLLWGDDGDNGPGSWPAMPTWAMVARRYDDPSVPFAGLVSAAGGTGSCCYDSDPTDDTLCDPVADAIDVCDWISGRDETALRTEIESGYYVCGQGEGYVQTGAMHFGENNSSSGVKKQIACHLAGRYNNSGQDPCENDDSLQNTNVLGIMSCVRQIPASYDSDLATFSYCDDLGNCEELTICDDDIDNDGTANDEDGCPYDDTEPKDADGDGQADDCPTDKTAAECTGVEWVDPNRRMYVITGVTQDGGRVCDDAANVVVSQCPNEGNACTVSERLNGATAYGRCTLGQIYCDAHGNELCQQLYNPMPEICNGLDDDCDGDVDNLSTSWDDTDFNTYDPTKLGDYDSDGVQRTGIHCYERDVCSCSAGPLDYGGPGYEAHIMSWTPGSCVCGEGLGDAEQAGGYTPAPASMPGSASEPKAGCSTTGGGNGGAIGWIAFAILGLIGLRRSRG